MLSHSNYSRSIRDVIINLVETVEEFTVKERIEWKRNVLVN